MVAGGPGDPAAGVVRRTRPASAPSGLPAASPSSTPSGLESRERTNLDRHLDGPGDPRRPTERVIEVVGLDDVEAAQVFLGLHEGAVGGHHLAVSHMYDGGRGGFVQATGEDPGAGRLQLLLEDAELLVGLGHLLIGHGLADLAPDAVDRQQVVRHGVLRWWAGPSRLAPQLRTGPAQIDTSPQETRPPAKAPTLTTSSPCRCRISGASSLLFARSTM